MIWTEAVPRVRAAAQAPGADVAVGPDNIGGVVTSTKGPEAGVWVIAETKDLGTQFRKIVVTDDRGRYLLPELPKATYQVWVRGYGLVDSPHVKAVPGASLALTAVVAPDARAAAQYYPGNYWYSLLQVPPKSAFPMKLPPVRAEDRPERFLDCRGGGATGCAERGGGMALAGFSPDDLKNGFVASNQAEYIYTIKRTCLDCHQMGNKVTREVNPALGHFASSTDAWERMLKSGQTGGLMMAAVDIRFGHERGLSMFADWTDRIAAGEVPAAPPRPQGVERNVVLTIWDFATDRSFVHDVAASNGIVPTANAYGKIYGTDNSSSTVEWVDPVAHTKGRFAPPPTPNNPNTALPSSLQYNEAPSPFWGDEIVWGREGGGGGGPQIDPLGRLWYSARPPAPAAFCGGNGDNPFAKNFPLAAGGGLAVYDPKTGQQTSFPVCGVAGSHRAWDNDADRTLYATTSLQTGGFAWFKTRVWDETHDPEKANGWCPGILDYNGDGKVGAYTRLGEPADPTLDRLVSGALPYGAGSNPVDHSFWVVGGVLGGPKTAIPGRVLRYARGSNPPATCTTEVYEPPFNNPKAPGVEGYVTQGVEIDSKGIAWVTLGGSAHIASFDRSKCKVLRGPTATGQHCPEGWTLYPVPGPTFKGTDVRSDYFYLGWVDRENTLGLGKDVPIANGTGSDSLIAFLPDQKKFVTLRVPYPMDFYTRSMTGRIDDPKAGWKGRGIWAGNNERVVWHVEGGKGTTSEIVHFQIRPDPLAK
ncbi:MAG: carboxypeptidase-like regulatory domain-containing protein [Acidobacteriota bacterium]